ncbi:MAG: hypothetical protein ACI3VZ_00555 [Faecousia sp.]
MFAYCGNNPVSFADNFGDQWFYTVNEVVTTEEETDDKGNATYKTVIKYSAYCPSNQLFVPEITVEGELEYEFTVDSRGVAKIDNSKYDHIILGDEKISEAMAEEIIKAATTQVPGSMSGRTISGVARELRLHCDIGYMFSLGNTDLLFGLSKQILVADIGGMDPDKPDYDYNAKGFENLWALPAAIWELIKG